MTTKKPPKTKRTPEVAFPTNTAIIQTEQLKPALHLFKDIVKNKAALPSLQFMLIEILENNCKSILKTVFEHYINGYVVSKMPYQSNYKDILLMDFNFTI